MREAQSSCQNLLRQCQSSTGCHSHSRIKQKSALAHLRSKISTSKMVSRISPQEEEENNKIIDRMRSKYHRKQKETSIKKTDLGEDLLTFTPEEFQKLQFIDQCQHNNILYRQVIDLPTADDQNAEKMTAVERLKKMGRLDDILDEIRTNIKWGEAGEAHQKKYFLRFKESKGFQKRSGQHRQTIVKKLGRDHKEERKISGKHSLQKYYHTLLNKNSLNRNFLNSQPQWSAHPATSLSFAEKVEIIRDEAARNLVKLTSNSSSNLYMTEQRRNALYQCQMLRLSKKILGNKEFQKLQFSLGEKENEVQEQHLDENNVQNQSKNCQAEEILEKNHKRIKEERKRVIEKLLC